jgi:hypothetical protein
MHSARGLNQIVLQVKPSEPLQLFAGKNKFVCFFKEDVTMCAFKVLLTSTFKITINRH